MAPREQERKKGKPSEIKAKGTKQEGKYDKLKRHRKEAEAKRDMRVK